MDRTALSSATQERRVITLVIKPNRNGSSSLWFISFSSLL